MRRIRGLDDEDEVAGGLDVVVEVDGEVEANHGRSVERSPVRAPEGPGVLGKPLLPCKKFVAARRHSRAWFRSIPAMTNRKRGSGGPVRYAVVGQGYIAQAAVLPAFAHAKRNSRLAALVSGDATKRRELGRMYGVDLTYSYEEYEDCVRSGEIDAVYIALPNSQHREYAVRAAKAGVHVLCEKPLAVDEQECLQMIATARQNRVKLMTAYRLHFEQATLSALEKVARGEIGDPRLFVSSFTLDVKPPNIRLDAELGGGTLYDIGIYCINAARHVFRAEPVEVFAMRASKPERRFAEVEESMSATVRFPGERLATFVVSFGADKTSEYRVVGTEGSLRVEPAYELAD